MLRDAVVRVGRVRRQGVRIMRLEPMRVARFRAKGKEPEALALGYLQRWLLDQRLRDPKSVRLFGFDVETSAVEHRRGIRGYEVWAPVPEAVRPSAGVGIRRVPSGLYAVLHVRDALVDPQARIPAGWKALAAWVQRSREVRLTEGLCLEEHIASGGSVHLDLLAPVVRVPRPRPRRVPR